VTDNTHNDNDRNLAGDDAPLAFTNENYTADDKIDNNGTPGAANTITFSSLSTHVTAHDGANTITGTSGHNYIVALGGADTITVSSGNNYINAGEGINTISAASGRNYIITGDNADTITVGAGHNEIHAGEGINTITATAGNNTIETGSGADTITASDGHNTITTTGGINTITVGGGHNHITSGDGADTITAGGGGNLINAGGGINTVTTGAGNDEVHAGVDTDTITTGAGDDHIHIEGGTDTITAGTGNDTMYVDFTEARNVVVTSAFAGTVADGYAGNINGIGITTFAGVENFQIVSGEFDDTLWTKGGNDIVDGGEGNDIVILGGGNDVGIYNIDQNRGNSAFANDIYEGGDGIDTLALEFTEAEWLNVQDDIAGFQAHLAGRTYTAGEADSDVFDFVSFGLTVSEFEHLSVRIDVGNPDEWLKEVVGDVTSFTLADIDVLTFTDVAGATSDYFLF
jgi:Ca2+-binding RTX toxin-like protein